MKLPAQDRGASLLLLRELVRLEPRLRDFVYVFDVPSTDLQSLERFAKTRRRRGSLGRRRGGPGRQDPGRAGHGPDLLGPQAQTFAYAVPAGARRDLEALADHICATGQLLCSSCQGIFLDNGGYGGGVRPGGAVLPRPPGRRPPASSGGSGPPGPGHAGTLRPGSLEADSGGRRRSARGGGVSVTAAPDSRLELGLWRGNCWVKPPAPGPDRPPAQAPEGLSPDRRAPLPGGGAGGPVRPPGPGRRGPDHRPRGHVPTVPGRPTTGPTPWRPTPGSWRLS